MSGDSLRIAFQGSASDVEVMHELLSPWNVSFTNLDEADLAIVYKEKPLKMEKTIIIPSDCSDFNTCVKNTNSECKKRLGKPVSVVAGSKTILSITPQTLYCYEGSIRSKSDAAASAVAEASESLVFLTLDVINEYWKILRETLSPKPSKLYRLITNLPIAYNLAPKHLRDWFMREQSRPDDFLFCDKLSLDALRFVLVRAIEKSSSKKLHGKMWNGKKHVFMLTHDVDTREGLGRAKKLKKTEDRYDLPSAWYIPSKKYRLEPEAIREFADHGEVGAHDTKHDGKLGQISGDKLIERLLEARKMLEGIIRKQVKGFRAPLLQHSFKIIHALRNAGYAYDTSIPTWEPKHPETMKAHGIATVYPMTIEGITEIPITLPQDHQLLNVLGLSPEEALKEWMTMMDFIKNIGGMSTILIHPDHKLAFPENSMMYDELLNMIASDSDVLVSLPMDMGDLAR